MDVALAASHRGDHKAFVRHVRALDHSDQTLFLPSLICLLSGSVQPEEQSQILELIYLHVDLTPNLLALTSLNVVRVIQQFGSNLSVYRKSSPEEVPLPIPAQLHSQSLEDQLHQVLLSLYVLASSSALEQPILSLHCEQALLVLCSPLNPILTITGLILLLRQSSDLLPLEGSEDLLLSLANSFVQMLSMASYLSALFIKVSWQCSISNRSFSTSLLSTPA